MQEAEHFLSKRGSKLWNRRQGQFKVTVQSLPDQKDKLNFLSAKSFNFTILQNIHLVAKWLSTLDKKVERYSIGSHDDYRVFMSAEPAPCPDAHIIPQGLLENAIKITNEPPTGMYANLHKALDLFTQVSKPLCPICYAFLASSPSS